MNKLIKVKLNREAVKNQLLKSDEMKNICKQFANDISQRAGSGYEVSTYTGSNRVNAQVFASTYRAKRDCIENNALLRALR